MRWEVRKRPALPHGVPIRSIFARFLGSEARADPLSGSFTVAVAYGTYASKLHLKFETVKTLSGNALPAVASVPAGAAYAPSMRQKETDSIPADRSSPVIAATSNTPALGGGPHPSPAILSVAVAPWGEVYVNGKKVGVTPPLTELRLAPGRYTVEIRNTSFPVYRTIVDLRERKYVKIRHRFQ